MRIFCCFFQQNRFSFGNLANLSWDPGSGYVLTRWWLSYLTVLSNFYFVDRAGVLFQPISPWRNLVPVLPLDGSLVRAFDRRQNHSIPTKFDRFNRENLS